MNASSLCRWIVLSMAQINKIYKRAKQSIEEQEAAANKRIDDKVAMFDEMFLDWTEKYNEEMASAVSLGMLISVLRVANKYISKPSRDRFFGEIRDGMQQVLDDVGEHKKTWIDYSHELEDRFGYQVPQWAMKPLETLDREIGEKDGIKSK